MMNSGIDVAFVFGLVWLMIGVVVFLIGALVLAWLYLKHVARNLGRERVPAACLTIRNGQGDAWSTRVDWTPVTIGRGPENDVVIDTPLPSWDTVSRTHACLYFDAQSQSWRIKDLDSRNGVFVNGRRTGHNVLRDGVLVGLGGVQVEFRVGGSAD